MAKERGLRRAGGKRLSESGSSRLLQQVQAEVLEQLEEQAAAATIPESPLTASSAWLAAAMLSWLVVASLLVFRPAVASGPINHPYTPPTVQREASLRYGIWLANASVQRFLSEQHRLPSFLAEAGVMDTTIAMRVTGETSYVLEGNDGEIALTLPSASAADSFLGESVRELRGD